MSFRIRVQTVYIIEKLEIIKIEIRHASGWMKVIWVALEMDIIWGLISIEFKS